MRAPVCTHFQTHKNVTLFLHKQLFSLSSPDSRYSLLHNKSLNFSGLNNSARFISIPSLHQYGAFQQHAISVNPLTSH